MSTYTDPRNPFRELESLFSALDRVWTTAGTSPGVNVYANDEAAVVTTEVPGVKAEQLRLEIHDDILSIAVEPDSAAETGTSLVQERPALRFNRRVSLPFPVDADRITAQLKDGILNIALNRAAADRPRRIQVNGN